MISCIVCALLLLQVVCRYAIDKKYDLRNFYNAVVEFKRNEDVVGKDNDYEVRFIQTYNEVKSERWWNAIWIVYIISLCAFLLLSKETSNYVIVTDIALIDNMAEQMFSPNPNFITIDIIS
jgi:hypothetical protein